MNPFIPAILLSATILGPLSSSGTAAPSVADSSSITVLANFDSAAVFIDSIFVGVTPLHMDTLSAGIHQIRLFHPDQANWLTGSVRDTFSIHERESRVLMYTLPVFGDTSGGKSLVLRPQKLGPESVFQNAYQFSSGSLRLYLSGGAAVLSGVAAAYFKIRADNRYNDFLVSNDALLRSESKNLDTTAALFLVATQVGLALFIYYLMSE